MTLGQFAECHGESKVAGLVGGDLVVAAARRPERRQLAAAEVLDIADEVIEHGERLVGLLTPEQRFSYRTAAAARNPPAGSVGWRRARFAWRAGGCSQFGLPERCRARACRHVRAPLSLRKIPPQSAPRGDAPARDRP